MTVPARSPVDDALDRLEHFLANGDPRANPMVDIATVRSALEQLREERDAAHRDVGNVALARMGRRAFHAEAELERLQRHPDAWSQEAFDQQKARAEAAEAEVERLREGLREIERAAGVGIAQKNRLPDVVGILATARALLADRPDGDCEHEWVSARNEAVLSGLICVKCHALAAEPDGANTEGGEA